MQQAVTTNRIVRIGLWMEFNNITFQYEINGVQECRQLMGLFRYGKMLSKMLISVGGVFTRKNLQHDFHVPELLE